jgi:hypothetical protein
VAQRRPERRIIRRVDAWTVLRFSLLFYLSLLVVWLVAGVLLWTAATASGVIDNIETFVRDLGQFESFRFRGHVILTTSVIAGLVLVLLGTGANVLVAVIYNLTSDVVGGVEVTVLDAEAGSRTVV